MLVDKLATAADVAQRFTDLDARTIGRILELAPTSDELDIAVRQARRPGGRTTADTTPSSARIASILEILRDLDLEPA